MAIFAAIKRLGPKLVMIGEMVDFSSLTKINKQTNSCFF